MNREGWKTLILWILVCMSILLIQQLWFPSPTENLSIAKVFNKNTNRKTLLDYQERGDIIFPENITVSFGSGDRRKNHYTIISENLDIVWGQSRNILKEYFLGEPEIKQIDYETYIEGNILKSIELEFGENIPTILVSSIFNSLENKIVRNIKEIKRILIPAFNRGTIYAMDNDTNAYEIRLKNFEDNRSLVEFIDKLEGEKYIKYHPIFSLFDELEGNYTPMPINYSLSNEQVYVENEIDIQDEAILIGQSKAFFNENFDFVKTVRETNGGIVYIYGYGEKSVRINKEGILEYNEEIGNISSVDVVSSLDAAINFISRTSGFPQGVYLNNIEKITSGKNKGYKFSFGYRIEGLPVELNHIKMVDPIEIEVYGDRIKRYRRLVREPIHILQGEDMEQTILYFPNIIEENINYLKAQYFEEDQVEEELDDERTLDILKNIKEVKMVYIDSAEEGQQQIMIPSWKIKIKEDNYYFNIHTGRLINGNSLN